MMGLKIYSIFILVCGFVLITKGETDANPLFQTEKVNKIEFWFDNNELWNEMATDYRQKNKRYVEVKCVINGQVFNTTGIRFKGKHSYSFAWTNKKPLKVKLNEFAEQEYFGTKKFNLANAFEDPSFQRDVQSLKVLRNLGVTAPRAGYAEVFINGKYFGLYVIIEQLDDDFLFRNFGENKGALFESEGFCFTKDSKLKELEAKGKTKASQALFIQERLNFFTDTNDELFFSEIESRFNVDVFLKCCAVDIYLGNRDSYAWGRCHNFYLYLTESGKLEWIAWDYNLSFGYEEASATYYPIELEANALLTRILTKPEYKRQYFSYVEDVSKYTSSRKFKKGLLQIQTLISPSVEADPNKFYSLDTFNLSLEKTILGGLTTNIPGILEFTKNQRKGWKEFKREKRLNLN